MISCTLQGSLDHFDTSVDAMDGFYGIYVYFITFRLVSDVWRRPRRLATAPPPASHDVAGPGIDMDLVEAQVRRTTSFCLSYVSPDSRQGVEQPAAGE